MKSMLVVGLGGCMGAVARYKLGGLILMKFGWHSPTLL